MKTDVYFIVTESSRGGLKSVGIATENGDLKYNFLISLLKEKVVLPNAQTNQILLEVLEEHRADSSIKKHLSDALLQLLKKNREIEERNAVMNELISELCKKINPKTVKDILEENRIECRKGEFVRRGADANVDENFHNQNVTVEEGINRYTIFIE